MTVTMTIFTEYLKPWDAYVGVRVHNIYLILDTCSTDLQDVSFLWNKCLLLNMGEHHSNPGTLNMCDQSFDNPSAPAFTKVT